MSSAAQSVSLLMLVAAAGLGSVAAFGIRHREKPGARGFSVAMLGSALWSAVLSVNIWPTQFLPLHVAMSLRNGLILVILLGWLLLVVEYVRREQVSFEPGAVAVVLAIPILTVVLTATNPYHHLAIGPGTPSAVGGGPAIEWGPWHLVFMAYAFVVSIAAAGVLVRDYWSAHGIHRKQLLLLLLGFAVGFVGVNDYLVTGAVEGIPTYVRISPFTFLLAGMFWALAVFRHRLFDLVPISRRTVVETIPDPVIAVDQREVIIDANPAARRLCNVSGDVAGTRLEAFCAEYPQIVEQYHDGEQRGEIAVANDGTERYFSVTIEPVQDRSSGSVIILRDVSELKAYEQQLETQRDNLKLLNEIIRHDIRNDLMVIHGYAETLDEQGTEEAESAVATIKESAENAITFTKKSRELTEAMVSTESVDKDVPLKQTIVRQVDAVREEHPTATVTTEKPLPETTVTADEMLGSVFRNLLENGIKHNDKDVPEVKISATERDDSVVVRVSDNGPGMSDAEKETMFNKGKTGQESSGTGIGLFLIETLVESYGGNVWIKDNDPEGAVFVVELPKTAE